MSAEADLVTPFEGLIGEVLANRYEIVARIGAGAMGAVYRAKHVKVGRAFAVKVLHPHLVADDKTRQRFEREAELAGRLHHPNVIGVVDVGETAEGLRYMVMDFAKGPDLATLMSEAPMPPQRIIHLVRQLLEGLHHAHEAGLIHRDFKPENVIVEKDSHGKEIPRIVDFGIAILREGGDSTNGPGRLTTNGLVLGTPHYMAPEQAVADPIDHRIDLFALGIIIYEMLSGKLPFDGNGAEVARANLLLDPPPIAERAPHVTVDPLLEAYARWLMAKKRDDRPANAKIAREVLDLIERDRDAAARALGVSPTIPREPATTQPSAPVRQHTGNDTFPPPIRTPPRTPALDENSTTPDPSRQPHVTTESTKPARRRAPIIGAVVAGIAVVAGGAVVMLRGGDEAKPTRADDTVASASPATVETAAPPPDDPAPVAPVEAVEASDELPLADTSDDTSADEPAPEATAENIDASPPSPPSDTRKTGSNKRPRANSAANKGKAEAKLAAKTDTQPSEPSTAEKRKPIDAGTLATQYRNVGVQLKALQDAKGQDAVADLWSRYRFIRLTDAMSTQEKRDAAAALLSQLASEAAARKKK